MAQNNNTPPAYYSSYTWPQMPHAQQYGSPYTPLQPGSSQPPAQPAPAQNFALPPDLAGLNLTPQQLAQLFSHFQAQSGAIPFPPPPPPPQFGAAPAHAAMHMMPSFPPPPPPPPPAQGTQEQDRVYAHNEDAQPAPSPRIKSQRPSLPEREDGELSDTAPKSRSASGPKKRKLNASPHEKVRLVSHRSSQYSHAQTNGHGHPRPDSGSQAHTGALVQHSVPAPGHMSNASGDKTNELVYRKTEALAFVAALHHEGFSYEDLVREGYDPALLRNVYEELHISLPTTASSKPGADVRASDAANMPSGVSDKITAYSDASSSMPTGTTKTENAAMAASTSSKAVAVAPPVDRQSYLARLQAAKNKKISLQAPKPPTSTAAPALTPLQAPAAVPEAPEQPLTTAQHLTLSTPSNSGQAKEQTKNRISADAATELVRKKMEALKSVKRRLAPQAQAASPAPPVSGPHALPPPPQDGTDPAESTASSNTLEMPVRGSDTSVASTSVGPSANVPPPGFSPVGIPGLFMATVAQKSNEKSTKSQLQPAPVESPPQPEVLQTLRSESRVGSHAAQSPQSVLTPGSRPTSTLSRRPVAADLNDVYTPPDAPLYKRPFGRSRQNSSDDAMVIEVSDDEGGPGHDEPAKSASLRQKSIRDLPPLRDFPQRSTLAKTGATQGTATPLGTPGTSSEAEELRRKEREINALQLKIQEFELRKRALKARGQFIDSRPETPSFMPQGSPNQNLPQLQAAKTANVTLPNASVVALPGLTPVKPVSDRHSKLQADISASDLALNSRRTQMMELQRQMADLQKQCDEEEQKKQQLREQLENLDVDTEGMTHVEMQAKKDEIDKQTHEQAEAENRSKPMIADAESQPQAHEMVQTDVAPRVSNSIDTNIESSSEEGQISETGEAGHAQNQNNSRLIPGLSNGGVVTNFSDTINERHAKVPQHDNATLEDSSYDDGSSMSESTNSETNAPVLQGQTSESEVTAGRLAQINYQSIPGLSAAGPVVGRYPETINEIVTSGAQHEVTTSEDTSDDDGSSMSESSNSENEIPVELARLFVANLPFSVTKDALAALFTGFDIHAIDLPLRGKKPTGYGFISLPTNQAASAIEQLNDTLLSDRNVAVQMARSREITTQATTKSAISAIHTSSVGSSRGDIEMDTPERSQDAPESLSNEDGQVDDYSAESTQAAPVNSASNTTAETAGASIDNEELEDTDMDLDSSESDDDNLDYEPASVILPAPASHPADVSNEGLTDDPAAKSQTSFEPQSALGTPNVASGAHYESSLKMFKKYRFHPDYLKNVPGGFHSLTYSHNIDPHKPLCRFEFAGGICRNRSCNDQHWRDMALSDDQLLIQLGTSFANPGKTKEDIGRFNAGLKGIIQQLRQEDTSDTEIVGARIAEYRRQFIGDPTVVLAL